MFSEERTEDPCRWIPQTFVDRERMQELSREIKGLSAACEATNPPAKNLSTIATEDRKPWSKVSSPLALEKTRWVDD